VLEITPDNTEMAGLVSQLQSFKTEDPRIEKFQDLRLGVEGAEESLKN
jgi:hypothetical protein